MLYTVLISYTQTVVSRLTLTFSDEEQPVTVLSVVKEFFLCISPLDVPSVPAEIILISGGNL